jgi:hypothetical protein
MIVRQRISRRNRRKLQPSQTPLGTNADATNSIVATKWRMVFNMPVNVAPTVGAFADWTNEGVAPTSVTAVNATTVDLGYAAAVIATDVAVIPPNSSAITTQRGGVVNATTHTFS